MEKNILNYLNNLVRFETTPDKPKEIKRIFEYIDRQLNFYSFIKKEYTHKGAGSVVWSTKDTIRPEVILAAHVDVVPANPNMFNVRKKDGKLIGRGTIDMKFAIASFIHALKTLHDQIGLDNTSVAMILTSDEEKGGFHGVNYLVNKIGYKSKLVILPDGGNNWKVCTRAKGASWIKISAKGKSSHASTPWRGENAINKLTEVISYLTKTYTNPQNSKYATTVNIGTITGGKTPNQVAKDASAIVDIRYVSRLTLQNIKKDLKNKYPNIEFEQIVDKPNFQMDENNKYILDWISLVKNNRSMNSQIYSSEHGSADHHYFTDMGMATLVTRPSGGGGHSDQEWIEEKDFYLFTRLLSLYLTSLFREETNRISGGG